MIHTIRQFELVPISTFGAGLTRIGGVDLDVMNTGPFCLVSQAFKKHSPRCVPDGFINTAKVIFLHIVDRKVFNDYGVESVYELTTELMRKIMSFPFNSFMDTSNYLTSFPSGYSRLLLSGKFSLSFCESPFFFPEEPRVFDMFPIGERNKVLKTHIDSNRRIDGLLNRFMIDITGKGHKPFSCECTPDGACLNYPLNRSMQFDLNTTYFGKPNNVFKKLETGLRISEAIISEFAAKSWIAGFFTPGLNPTKKGPESKIDPCRNILKCLTVNIRQKWVFLFKTLEGVALIIARNTFLFSLPGSFSLFEKMVIQPAATIKGLLKGCSLFMCWKNSIFKSFSHIYTLAYALYKIKHYFLLLLIIQ